AFIAALEALKARRVHILGAYPRPVTQAFIDCLATAGFVVDAWRALNALDGASSFRLDLAKEVARFADRLPDGDAAPLLIPDTAIDSLDLLTRLESGCGRRVLSANQVTLWHGLRLLGIKQAVPRAGSLLVGSL
ncbi:MAG: hypothetical protein WD489_08190, partial [Rhodovibrionaceae bacterium]